MIISMKMHATRAEIDAVRGIVEHFGYKVHSIEAVSYTHLTLPTIYSV